MYLWCVKIGEVHEEEMLLYNHFKCRRATIRASGTIYGTHPEWGEDLNPFNGSDRRPL